MVSSESRAAALVVLVVSCLGSVSAQSNHDSLPIVDLGYQWQQATAYNSTGGYYNFSNIRYAAPPTGANRFNAPQLPAVNRSVVQVGFPSRICPQADPVWPAIVKDYLPLYLAEGRTTFSESDFDEPPITSSNLPIQDSRTTEDCLFLDVVVPEGIFNSTGNGPGAPVLVWIYGGGYTEGSKTDSGNPAGLLARSEGNNAPGVIYVAMNYRLGAFGWLSGPTFQQYGSANAGLLDQRFALEWVQQHIAKFGGDPNRVTVFGESAGGGSLMHQITAYGGLRGPAPFQQAILQSPGFLPVVSAKQQEQTFNAFLQLLNVSTVAEARELPYYQVQVANILQVGASPLGSFTYGPTVDGLFVPALPGELLLHGQFDQNLKIMVGHNADEGLEFTSPFIQNDSALANNLLTISPNLRAWPAVLSYITDTLYPPIFDGSQAQGYKDQIARSAAIISEAIFACNTFYLNKAFRNNTHAYIFSIPPALHGQDVPYTYYYGGADPTVTSVPIAIALQEFITHFAETGTPNAPGTPDFPIYGPNATALNLGVTGISEAVDPVANYRCNWWQKGLYI